MTMRAENKPELSADLFARLVQGSAIAALVACAFAILQRRLAGVQLAPISWPSLGLMSVVVPPLVYVALAPWRTSQRSLRADTALRSLITGCVLLFAICLVSRGPTGAREVVL